MYTNVNKWIVSVAISLGLFAGSTPALAKTVEKGDTMSKIADEHNLTLNQLSSLNPQVKNINLIYVGENINTNVGTKATTKTYSNKKPVNTTSKVSKNVDAGTLDLFARLVDAEARSESYAGKVAVAEVILNRVNSPQFPNTITGVIYQTGQFSPVTDGSINRRASQSSVNAVNEALAGIKDSQSLYFYNPAVSGSNWLDSLQTTKVVGNHVFKK